MTLASGTHLGRYEIRSELGAGGMGEVYRAFDPKLNREVAIKVLPAAFSADKDRLARFEQEAQAAGALNHPNILSIYDVDTHAGSPYVVSELLEGETLRRSFSKAMKLNEVLDIVIQIASALSAAHAAGIIHRDIKPDNIMLRRDGLVKVLDFGLAKLSKVTSAAIDLEAPTRADVKTSPGLVMGTVNYMSPEQARGQVVDVRTDVWSLGVVLYEMLTGRLPFAGDTITDSLASILRSEAAPVSSLNHEVPGELETIIAKALRKEREARYQTVKDMLTDLRQLRKRLEFAAELKRTTATQKHAEAETQIIKPETRESIAPFSFANLSANEQQTSGAKPKTRHTVGREKERAELRSSFESVVNGRSLLICVAGEPGIGKTTLVEDFLAERAAAGRCTIARGRCSERLAGTEAYLPLLEALESLLQSGSNTSVVTAIKQTAPTWYMQIAPLSSVAEETSPLVGVRAASQERMKRELAAFVQEASRLQPLVIFFDDLHWADVSTIDLLSFLAGKFDAARVLIVVTYRPSDMLLAKHPFLQIKPDLQARGLCRELPLEFLAQPDVAQYLTLEFPGHNFPAEFPKLIYEKTEGSPLFMTDLVRDLRNRNVIAMDGQRWTLAQALPDIERELPESVRGMIERKIAQLSDEDRKLLVAASVQGYEFDSAVVAQALELDAVEVEERLEKLERIQAFIKLIEEGEFPDRTLTLRYRFVHVLYQNALYAGLRATRKVQLNSMVARTLEGYYGEKSEDVAHELALLWEAAREPAKAADYFRLAAEQAAQVFANQEAAMLASRGLKLIETLPDTPERDLQELALQVTLGTALRAVRGFGGPEVGRAYERARALCQHTGETSQLVPVLRGLWEFHELRAEYEPALEFGKQLLTFAQERQDPSLLLVAHDVLGDTFVWLGDFVAAREHLEQGIALYDADQHRSHIFLYGYDSGMACLCFAAKALWHLGYPDQALKRIDEALILARELSHPMSLIFALPFAAWLHQLRGERQAAQERAETCITISAEQGFPFWLGWGTILRGWALVAQGKVEEGAAQIRQGIDAYRATGADLGVPWFLGLLAEACGEAGRTEEGLTLLAEALDMVSKTGERFYEAELYRLRGELLLKSAVSRQPSTVSHQEAETCFRQAIEIAQRQSAKSLELRAAMSLARLWQEQGKREEARTILAEIYNWFTEGFDTADLKAARVLLEI